MRVCSLFTGVGGADYGFFNEGFELVFANDIYVDAQTSYEANFQHPMWLGGLESIPISSIPDCDIIIGGPPCQTFSNAKTSSHFDKRTASGLRNVYEMKRIVEGKKPKIFICENVSTLLDSKMIHSYLVFKEWEGYNVRAYRINAEDYGIPQKRIRVFFIGVREDLPFIFREPDTDHWSNRYSGWAEYLGLSSDYVMLKRMSAKEIVYADQAAYTITCVEQPVVCKWHPKLGTNLRTAERLAHGIYPRYITISELKKLQGFPEHFVVVGNKISKYKQIGNAWCTCVSTALAKECKRCLEFFKQYKG